MDAPPPYSPYSPEHAPPASAPIYQELLSTARPSQGDQQSTFSPPSELQQSGFISAAPYFALRSPTRPPPAGYFVYTIILDSETESLPSPSPVSLFQQNEVDSHDWRTFTNHLFPPRAKEFASPVRQDHSSQVFGSSEVENKKGRHVDLPAMVQRMSTTPNKTSAGGVPGSESSQLLAIRTQAVLREWNAGFFEPRGLKIFALPSEEFSSDDNDTPLHQAVSRGKKSEVRLLLDHSSQIIDARNKKGETPLFRAVSQGETSIVEMLLEKDANPNARPPQGNSCIFTAVRRDDTKILTMLLGTQEVGLDEITPTGESALYYAVSQGQRKNAQLLLDAGASPHVRPVGKDTLLDLAVSRSDSALFRSILESGADPNQRNRNGDTPLSLFLLHGRSMSTSNLVLTVRMLLDRGVNPNAKNGKGETPLSLAIRSSLSSVVPMLLEKNNIDIDTKNSKGESPLSHAIAQRDKESSIILLQHGADPNTTNASGEHVLYRAICNGNSSLVALLLTHNARADAQGANGESALYRAVQRGETATAALLLSFGADPDSTGVNNETCLWRAVEQGDSTLAALLISRGATVDAPTSKGETPLYRAAVRDDTSMATMLLARGADSKKAVLRGESPLDYALRKGNDAMLRLFNLFLARQAKGVVSGTA
jgi:ankyrin repeat protein